MSNPRDIKRSQGIKISPQDGMEAAHTVEAIEFTGMLGSKVNPKWFDWLMEHSGTYLFTTVLLLSVLKLGISIYQYVKSPNKNINENVSLGWTVLQTAMISTAIIGGLVAATLFVIITPALMVAAIAADTLRNLGFLFWNIGKLASLRFQVRKELEEEESLTGLIYEALKEKYIEKIKAHAIGLAVGLVMVTTVSINFLFPQIGLASIGAFVVGKLTIAGIAGIVAAGALTIPLLPTVYRLAKWGLPKIGNGIKNAVQNIYSFFKSKFEKEEKPIPFFTDENQEQLQNTKPIKRPELILPTAKHRSFRITNEDDLKKAINHSAFSQHSRFRETIIDHIDIVNKDFATKALQKMVEEKIAILKGEISEGEISSFRYFAEKQRPKRTEKLYALALIQDTLSDNKINTIRFSDITDLINDIESRFPGVKESFFLDQSDTQNIVEALKVYAYKFIPEESENSNILDSPPTI